MSAMSGRARRMVRNHEKHKAAGELNLIPMIDILSVLVMFLLVYSTEVEIIQNTKGVEIPESIAEAQPKDSVVIMVTTDHLFVQGEQVASIAEIRATEGPIIEPLRAALKRPMLVGQAMAERSLARREITLMGDKAIPYEVVKKVMATCTDADYGRISLATMQKEKPLAPGVFKPI